MSEPQDQLKFGVMCNDDMFRQHHAEIIFRLQSRDDTSLELLIVSDDEDEESNKASNNTMPSAESIPGPDILTHAYRLLSQTNDYRKMTDTRSAINKATWRLAQRFAVDNPSTDEDTVDLGSKLADVDRIRCSVKQDGFSQYFTDEDVVEIRSKNLDFVLRFHFGIIRGEILDTARYGVWSFHHGDERKYRGGPAGFWEVYEQNPVTGVVLQRLTDDLDSGIILQRGFFKTDMASWSDNLAHVVRGSTALPERVVVDLLEGQADYVDADPSTTNAEIYTAPSPGDLFRLSLRRLFDKNLSLLNGTNKWNIGVTGGRPDKLFNSECVPELSWFGYEAADGFSADPFIHTFEDETYLFFEDFDYGEGHGRISATTYPGGFERGSVESALELSGHISYPYVFEADDNVYATPETTAEDEIALYRLHTPTEWERVTAILEETSGVDPTIIRHNGRWWLFYTKKDEFINEHLYLQYADSITGPWTPHPKNPIKTDIRSARPAGRPWKSSDDLIRPGQYCATKYGAGLSLNRVTTLTPTDFSESIEHILTPREDSPYTGIHHVDYTDSLTVLDAKKPVWNWAEFRREARSIMGL